MKVYSKHKFSSDDNNNNKHQSIKYLQEFNTKIPPVFHPTISHFSNIKHRSFFMFSSAEDLTSNKRRVSLLNKMNNAERHLPLVMITDTNLAHTNIVELETFEDKHRLMTDNEKHITRQLKAPYRPRYST